MTCRIFLAFWLFTGLNASAQTSLTKQYTLQFDNPALQNQGISLYLPSAELLGFAAGPSAQVLIKENSDKNIVLDAESALVYAKRLNQLGFDLRVASLGISYGKNNWSLGIGHAFRQSAGTQYSEDLLKVLALGNAAFINQNLHIGPAIKAQAWHEYAINASYRWQNLQFGIRTKYLSGIKGLQTEESQFILNTSDDIYQLNLNNHYIVNSSGVLNYEDFNTINFDLESDSFQSFLSQNRGFALDLGLVYTLNEKFTISSFIENLGKISWEENLRNYSSIGEIEYSGVDITDYIRSQISPSLVDSLENFLDFEETNTAFSNKLNTRFTSSVDYQTNSQLRIGAEFLFWKLLDDWQALYSANVWYQWNTNLGIGVQYSYTKDEPVNLGARLEYNVGKLIFYGSVSDVIATSNLLGKKVQRLGFGILFRGL